MLDARLNRYGAPGSQEAVLPLVNIDLMNRDTVVPLIHGQLVHFDDHAVVGSGVREVDLGDAKPPLVVLAVSNADIAFREGK